jgi:glycosyltransferase 2 family protein
MVPDSGNNQRFRVPGWLAPALGYAVSLGCLVWVYKGFNWREELPSITAVDAHWVVLAVLADVSVYISQGWRWRLLLRPLQRVSLVRSVQAIYVGLFTNEVLPLRGGELVRCYLQAHWSKLPFSVVLSSALIERIFDGLWLVAGAFVVTSMVALPRYLIDGTRVLAGILCGFVFLVGVVMFHKHRAHAAIAKSRWAEMLWHVVEGLHSMGNSPSFYLSFLCSTLYLGLQIIPIYALMQGYGIGLPIGAAVVVMVVLRLGTLLPQAPGNVGSFQFFAVLGLRLFGVDKAAATGYATLLFLVVTLPLWLVGFVATLASGMSFGDIRRGALARRKP